jgi:hypothetical protein
MIWPNNWYLSYVFYFQLARALERLRWHLLVIIGPTVGEVSVGVQRLRPSENTKISDREIFKAVRCLKMSRNHLLLLPFGKEQLDLAGCEHKENNFIQTTRY